MGTLFTSNPVAAGGATSSVSETQTTMPPEALAALNVLIAQLAGGGTAAMKENTATKKGEVATLQNKREGYSKNAAFTDAQGAMSQELSKALAQMLPALVRSAEGSGTSANALRALMQQQAATDAAQAAATVGLNAAGNYGQASNQMSNIIAGLLSGQDEAAQTLIQALGIARGSQTTASRTTPVGMNLGGGGQVVAGGMPSGFTTTSTGVRDPFANRGMSYAPAQKTGPVNDGSIASLTNPNEAWTKFTF